MECRQPPRPRTPNLKRLQAVKGFGRGLLMANEGICTHPITPLTIHMTRTGYVIIRACFYQENKDKISYLVYLRGDSRIQWDCGCEGVSRGDGIVAQSLSHVHALVPPWTGARQADPSSTVSWISLRFMPIKSAMLYNHLILCSPHTPSWTTALLWRKGLRHPMSLRALLCRTSQNGRVIVKRSDKAGSTGEGNGSPL